MLLSQKRAINRVQGDIKGCGRWQANKCFGLDCRLSASHIITVPITDDHKIYFQVTLSERLRRLKKIGRCDWKMDAMCHYLTPVSLILEDVQYRLVSTICKQPIYMNQWSNLIVAQHFILPEETRKKFMLFVDGAKIDLNLSVFDAKIKSNITVDIDEPVTQLQSISEVIDCAICFLPLLSCDMARIRRCRHQFHLECLQELVTTAHVTARHCPMCRAGFSLVEFDFDGNGSFKLSQKKSDPWIIKESVISNCDMEDPLSRHDRLEAAIETLNRFYEMNPEYMLFSS